MFFLKKIPWSITIIIFILSCGGHTNSENQTSAEPFLEILQLFDDKRFPSAAVATDGTILSTFSGTSPANEGHLKVRRSEDGGKSWTEFLENE